MAKELAERSLAEYVKQAWKVLEPDTPLLWNWHLDLICEYLEAVTAGQIRRLIINVPPRSLKSTIVTICWPTWEWGPKNRPGERFLAASYSQNLSTKHSVDRRTLIQSDWYQRLWGDRFALAGDQNLKTEFANDKRGFMFATSVGGTATGKGGNRLIVDDPLNPQEAASDVERVKANTWFDQTFYTRLNDKKRGAIVVVMQRLHEMDLTGHLLAKESGWELVKIQGITRRRTVHHFPISGREVIREEGDVLHPEREDREQHEELKRTLGSYAYAGQYDQEPAPAEGGVFKRHWWRYWKPSGVDLPPVEVRLPDGSVELRVAVDLPDDLTNYLQSWDMAFKDTESSAYVVGQVWASRGADRFLLDQLREKLDFVGTTAAVKRLSSKWPQAAAKLVEDKANGPAVISSLRSTVPGLIAVDPEGDKVARAYAVSPIVESGNVYIPHPMLYGWVDGFLHEATMFPNSDYKDQVDAMTQALRRLGQFAGPRVRSLR